MKLQPGKKVPMNRTLAESTTMKIHRHGVGAKGGWVQRCQPRRRDDNAPSGNPRRRSCDRGFLTGGNVSDIPKARELTAEVVGGSIVQDLGYDSDAPRRDLEANNTIPVIPGRTNRNTPVVYDKALYKLRRTIEMCFGKIKENRRVTIRYEKTDAAFLAFIALAIIKTYL
jgi:transposase